MPSHHAVSTKPTIHNIDNIQYDHGIALFGARVSGVPNASHNRKHQATGSTENKKTQEDQHQDPSQACAAAAQEAIACCHEKQRDV